MGKSSSFSMHTRPIQDIFSGIRPTCIPSTVVLFMSGIQRLDCTPPSIGAAYGSDDRPANFDPCPLWIRQPFRFVAAWHSGYQAEGQRFHPALFTSGNVTEPASKRYSQPDFFWPGSRKDNKLRIPADKIDHQSNKKTE